jgi:hypothetical protein
LRVGVDHRLEGVQIGRAFLDSEHAEFGADSADEAGALLDRLAFAVNLTLPSRRSDSEDGDTSFSTG